MQYLTAWLIRTLNRILLLVVAIVTVMWMLFLLDMNAATLQQQQIHYKRHQSLMKLKSLSTQDPDDKYFSRLEVELKQKQVIEREPEYHIPEPANPEPPKIAVQEHQPEVELKAQPEVKDLIPVAAVEKHVEPAKMKPVPPIVKDHVVAKGAGGGGGGGGGDVAKPPKKTTTTKAPTVPPAEPAHPAVAVIGKVVDSKILTQFKLADLDKIPPLPISQETSSSCFCVDNSQGSNAISADDAVLLGCPKQENLQIRCLPKFFLAGCNNCGSTDLQFRLNKHQLVNFGAKKEPEFWTGKFSIKFSGSPDDLDHYTSQQYNEETKQLLDALRAGKKKKEQPIIGEMAPTLYYSMIGKWGSGGPSVAAPLKRLLPDAKFIFLLRDPIERTIAQYNGLPSGPKSPEDFDSTVDTFLKWFKLCNEKRKMTEHQCMYGAANSTAKLRPTKLITHDIINSIYYIPMKEWVNKVGKENILVLKFEDYMINRLETIKQKVVPFLGIKEYANGPLQLLQNTEADKTMKLETQIKIQMTDETREKLNTFFTPFNNKLATLLEDPSFTWS